MSTVEPIVALLWSGEPEQVEQAAELLRSLPELIPAASVRLAAVERLEQLHFLSEDDPEIPRGLADALALRSVERLLDQMVTSEQAVLAPLLEATRAAHRGERPGQAAVSLGYRIARANRQHNRVRQLVRLMLTTLEPLEERLYPWWQLAEQLSSAAPDIAARDAWERTWDAEAARGQPRAAVRAAARAARDEARDRAQQLEHDAIMRDTWLLAPPVIRAALRDWLGGS